MSNFRSKKWGAIYKAIWRYEYYSNGLQRISGGNVIVKKLRVLEDNFYCYRADITLCWDLESEREEYPDCVYNPDVLRRYTPNFVTEEEQIANKVW